MNRTPEQYWRRTSRALLLTAKKCNALHQRGSLGGGITSCRRSLPRPLCSRVRPDVRDRQTDVRQSDVRQKHRLMSRLLGAGHNNTTVYTVNLATTVYILSTGALVDGRSKKDENSGHIPIAWLEAIIDNACLAVGYRYRGWKWWRRAWKAFRRMYVN